MPPKNSKSKRSGSGDKQNPMAEPPASESSISGENAPKTEEPTSASKEETTSGEGQGLEAPTADQNVPPTGEAENASVENEQAEAHENIPQLDPSQQNESQPDIGSKDTENEKDVQKFDEKPKEDETKADIPTEKPKENEAKIDIPDEKPKEDEAKVDIPNGKPKEETKVDIPESAPQQDEEKKPDAEPKQDSGIAQSKSENAEVKSEVNEKPARSPTPIQSPTVVPEERSDVSDMPRERSKRRSRRNRDVDVKEEDQEDEKPRRRHRRRRNYDDEDDDEDENQGREVGKPRAQRPKNLEQRRTQEPLVPTPQEQPEKSGGKQPLRLRLDVNLEVDIELRARIHGDLTLALLS